MEKLKYKISVNNYFIATNLNWTFVCDFIIDQNKWDVLNNGCTSAYKIEILNWLKKQTNINDLIWNYESKSSFYFYSKRQNKLFRISNHWSNYFFENNKKMTGCGNIRSCYWSLKNIPNKFLKIDKFQVFETKKTYWETNEFCDFTWAIGMIDFNNLDKLENNKIELFEKIINKLVYENENQQKIVEQKMDYIFKTLVEKCQLIKMNCWVSIFKNKLYFFAKSWKNGFVQKFPNFTINLN